MGGDERGKSGTIKTPRPKAGTRASRHCVCGCEIGEHQGVRGKKRINYHTETLTAIATFEKRTTG